MELVVAVIENATPKALTGTAGLALNLPDGQETQQARVGGRVSRVSLPSVDRGRSAVGPLPTVGGTRCQIV